MTAQETQQLKALIVATGLYYGQPVHDQVLAIYVDDLKDLPFNQVVEAIKEVRRDPKTTRLPLASAIRGRIQPVASEDDIAIEAANRIVAAVSKFGWNNPDRARLFIGDLGWRVVEMEGGWTTVCETLTSDNLGTLKAQWRGLAKSSIVRGKAGSLNQAPGIPEPKRGGDLVPFGNMFKQIADRRQP